MLKKLLLFSICFSLALSPLAFGQQIAEKNILEKLSPSDLKTITQEVAQEIKTLSSELKESLIETIEQLSEKEIFAHSEWLYPVFTSLMACTTILISCSAVCQACSAVCTSCSLTSVSCSLICSLGGALSSYAMLRRRMQRRRNTISTV